MNSHPVLRLVSAVACAVFAAAPSTFPQGTPIGFEEEFALATDRAAVLEQLIPGTEEYYYYSCLHLLQVGALDEVEPMLRLWIQRHGRGQRVEEIENRQALLAYERDSKGTYAFLRNRLGLRFDHQREIPGQQAELPTRLDPSLLSRAALMRRALELHPGTLDGLRDSALEQVAVSQLDDDRLRSLLARLSHPDLPNLPALVVRDLEVKNRPGFGSLAIHQNLLLEQLEECLQLRPALLNEDAFVEAYLVRLRPGADVDSWRRRRCPGGLPRAAGSVRPAPRAGAQLAQGARALPPAAPRPCPRPPRQAALHGLPAPAAPDELREPEVARAAHSARTSWSTSERASPRRSRRSATTSRWCAPT